jgi:lambda repressor-like predicted transcriptional regulator
MSHLKLVTPEAAKPSRRKGFRVTPTLKPEQERAAKASLRGLCRRYGSQRKLSAALGLHPDTLVNALCKKGRISAEILVRAALITKTPLEVLLTPGPHGVAS